VVSSSLPIPDERDAYQQVQPPHIQARKTYEKYVDEIGGRKFLVTMEEPNGFHPAPLVFEITGSGSSLKRATRNAFAGIVSTVAPRAG
jgi:hypothetical protein